MPKSYKKETEFLFYVKKKWFSIQKKGYLTFVIIGVVFMQPELYDQLNKMEDTHWWFAARREILRAVIEKHLEKRPACILDAGCGTGGNLGILRSLGGRVKAMEINPFAAAVAADKHGAEVFSGSLPDNVPFPVESFDLIALFDVLEHVQDDDQALTVLASRLRPGGCLVVTVPAFPFLWSNHDEVHNHKRRYLAPDLAGKIERCGLNIIFFSYFNFYLFPIIALVRVIHRALPIKPRNGDLSMPAPILNSLLRYIMSSEAKLLQKTRLPFGVSLVAVARKN